MSLWEQCGLVVPWNLPEEDITSPFADDDELITLVGTGSVLEEDEHVKVENVPVMENGTSVGSYAYWVSDEASKASYAVPTDANNLAWNQASILGVPYRTAIDTLDDNLFSDYPDQMDDNPAAGNAVSYKTLDLLTGKPHQLPCQCGTNE